LVQSDQESGARRANFAGYGLRDGFASFKLNDNRAEADRLRGLSPLSSVNRRNSTMHTTTVRGLAALLAFVVAASSVRAAGPEDDKLSQVLTQLQEVNNKISVIQLKLEIQSTSMQKEVDQLKLDVNRLSDELRRLSPVKTTIAASINPDLPAPVTTGTLVLTNHYSVPALFIVNGRSIRVMPSQAAHVTEPAGRFNFSVYTDTNGLVYAPADRYLVAGRDYPITINP
jgi:hypothetical protein